MFNCLVQNHRRKGHSPKGFTLLELSVAIAIFATVSSGVAVPIIGNYLSNLDNQKAVQANAILAEGWEAVRSIRNRDWAELTDGIHGLLYSDQWNFDGESDEADGFTRVVTVSTLSRDSSGNLVDSGGTPDPHTKKITLRVSWQRPYSEPRSAAAQSILTDYKNPGAWPPIP